MDSIQNRVDKRKENLITSIKGVATARKMTSGAIVVFMLGLIGIFQFITLGCDVSALFTWSFYLTLAYRCVLVVLSYYVAVNFLYDKCIAHDDIQKAIREFKALTKFRDINFSDFLNNIYNPRRKKEAWRNKVNLQIADLEKKALNASKRKAAKLVEKINKLKLQLEDEFIDPRIDTLNVSYYRVLESDFLAAETINERELYKTRVDYEATLVKSVLKKVLPYILISLVMGALVTGSLTKPALEVILNLITDLCIIAMRISQGAWDAPRIINSSYLIPYNNKITILKEYIDWSATQEKTKAYKISQMIEKEIEEKEGE